MTFKYAYPLDSNRRQLFEEKGWEGYPSMDAICAEVDIWKEFWEEFNKDDEIIKEIVNLIGIIYPQNITAYVIGGGLNPMSTPLILPVLREISYEAEGARAELLVHEILHLFVGDIQLIPFLNTYWRKTREKYSAESPVVQHHIIIYALLIKIFEKFLPQCSIDDYIGDDWADYIRAYELVKAEGPDVLIEEFRACVAGE